MRLIDADELKQKRNSQDWQDTYLRACVDNAPTIDAVPVVRCGKCIHYCLHDAAGGKYCEILRNESPIESGWCCYGERRNDG